MLGADMGTLDVFVNTDNVFSATGDMGDQWNIANIDLSAYIGTDVSIVISGTTGSSFTSDMAIDAISLDECQAYGCTDSLASNYDASATADDGSCFFLGCTSAGFDNYDPMADTDDGSCFCSSNTVTVSFYDSWGDGWNGATMFVTDEATGDSITSGTLGGGSFYTDDICIADGCYEVVVGGGTFDSEITFDFGSLVGATAGTYSNISIGGAVCTVLGCTDSTASNYDALADTDDGSCVYCTDNYVALSLIHI